MRIVIIGAGGIGGWLGTRLSASGQQVGFLVHDRTLAALRSGGLTLRDCSGGEPGTVAARIETPLASDAPEELTGALGGDPDLVFVTTKVDALPQLAPTLRRLTGPHHRRRLHPERDQRARTARRRRREGARPARSRPRLLRHHLARKRPHHRQCRLAGPGGVERQRHRS